MFGAKIDIQTGSFCLLFGAYERRSKECLNDSYLDSNGLGIFKMRSLKWSQSKLRWPRIWMVSDLATSLMVTRNLIQNHHLIVPARVEMTEPKDEPVLKC
ncbi:hypothetical protein EGR_09529 [Echinococcus granulosus]|uniref:Uncharacterized protein n=1 Tax=Echinococcus granulosus TaxID=6210 RepID=W6UQC1_ECHGR|nr:hypothetical protein EGR_09529 [Echinococcus granulosus]EUB55589.1 hypothetical protein EGR_09529 [Echinococcus granulosus]